MHPRLLQHGVGEVGPAQVGVRQVGVAQLSTGEHRSLAARVVEFRAVEAGLAEAGASERGTGEARAAGVDAFVSAWSSTAPEQSAKPKVAPRSEAPVRSAPR